MMEVLYNFRDYKYKGATYEELPIEILTQIIGRYDGLLNNPKYVKFRNDELKEHYQYALSVYQGKIIDKIDYLARKFNLDESINIQLFDFLFRNRKNNKDNKGFLDILDPLEENELTKKNQLLLGDVIIRMVTFLSNDDKNRYLQAYNKILAA